MTNAVNQVEHFYGGLACETDTDRPGTSCQAFGARYSPLAANFRFVYRSGKVGMREVIPNDSNLYHAVHSLLGVFREKFCPKDWRILAFDLAREGPELILTVRDESFAPRELKGRLSGFMLLCGRYFGATRSEAIYSKMPVFLRNVGNAGVVETGARDGLIEAALWMDRSGELEEATFILRRAAFGCGYRQFSGSATIGHALPTDASPALVKAVLQRSELPGLFGTQESWNVRPAMKVVIPHLRHPDNLERAVAVTAAEDILSSAKFNASSHFPELAEMTGPLLSRLVSDENAFIQERALASFEIIGDRLFCTVREHWRPLLPAIESLLAAGVNPEWQLQRRFACRLWSGDDAGASQDMQARLALEQTPPTPQLSAFFKQQIQACGRSVPFQSLQQSATSLPSTPPPGEVAAPSQSGRKATPAAKPRGKRRPIEPIDPMEFVALMVTSVRDDFVKTALAGPRASECCLNLNIAISGVPRGGPMSRFAGPRYSLRRAGDAYHALDIYRRLDHAYVAKKRPKALSDLVAKIAEEQAEDTRFIWFLVREIFDDSTGAGREQYENAIARQTAGDDLTGLWLNFGNQIYRSQGDRAEKLVALFEQAFASGMGPALAHAVLNELPQRLQADKALQSLPRAPGFNAELRFIVGDLRRTEFSIG